MYCWKSHGPKFAVTTIIVIAAVFLGWWGFKQQLFGDDLGRQVLNDLSSDDLSEIAKGARLKPAAPQTNRGDDALVFRFENAEAELVVPSGARSIQVRGSGELRSDYSVNVAGPQRRWYLNWNTNFHDESHIRSWLTWTGHGMLQPYRALLALGSTPEQAKKDIQSARGRLLKQTDEQLFKAALGATAKQLQDARQREEAIEQALLLQYRLGHLSSAVDSFGLQDANYYVTRGRVRSRAQYYLHGFDKAGKGTWYVEFWLPKDHKDPVGFAAELIPSRQEDNKQD